MAGPFDGILAGIPKSSAEELADDLAMLSAMNEVEQDLLKRYGCFGMPRAVARDCGLVLEWELDPDNPSEAAVWAASVLRDYESRRRAMVDGPRRGAVAKRLKAKDRCAALFNRHRSADTPF
jgi:hypothetical protein